jgi:hypothetical protein
MRGHENSLMPNPNEARGHVAGRSTIQIDIGSFGGRSTKPGSVPTSERGVTAAIDAIKPLRLARLVIGSTPAK